jgi:hypothetical protein
MTQDKVAQVTEQLLDRVKRTLVQKNTHYVSADDKLWNFKTQAAYEGKRGSEVCLSHLLKQMTTILKASRDPMPLTFGTATEEGILQKPVDLIAYLCLWVCLQMDEQGVEVLPE